MRIRDRLVRTCLVAIDRLVGGSRPDVRTTCRYAIHLIDAGATAELYALVRHRIRRAWGKTAASRQAPGGRPLVIDARTQQLSADGGVVAKANPPWIYPDHGAPVLVGVVIPCFNYGRYVAEAVASVRAQTLASTEIIVVDDGSTDEGTLEVLARLGAEPDVRVIRQPNQGLPAARNRGIEAAAGEYICCLDADDTLSPTYLEQTIAILEADRSVGFAGSWVRFFGDVEEIWRTEDFDPERALVGNFTSVASVFRRDDWRAVGGFSREMVDGFEDWEFWIRLALLGRRGRTIAWPLFNHRRHGRTMTDSAKAMQQELRQRMRRLSPAFYEDARIRRRMGGLVGTRPSEGERSALSGTGVVARDQRPGLVVVVTGLLEGGAHSLLHDILRSLRGEWRIAVVTTGPGPHALDPMFRHVTDDVFHLDGFLPLDAWPGFLNHLLESRRARVLLTSDCLWMLEQVPQLKAERPDLRMLTLVHNHVPTSTFRTAVANHATIDRYVVVSQRVVEALVTAGIPSAKIAEVANGVDTVMFSPERMGRDDARHHLALPASGLVLAWVGRMSEEKRPLLFVDLIEALRREMPVHGVMFGDGPEAPGVDAAVRARGLQNDLERRASVPRAALPDVYCAADLTVLTSRVEGMPLVILEALASGCPVLTTDVGDAARIVAQGVNGYLVPVGNPEALLERARAFARDPELRSRMRIAAAISLRSSPYQLSRMAETYARLLFEI